MIADTGSYRLEHLALGDVPVGRRLRQTSAQRIEIGLALPRRKGRGPRGSAFENES